MKKTGYNIIQFSLSKELQHGMMVSILAGELARKAGTVRRTVPRAVDRRTSA